MIVTFRNCVMLAADRMTHHFSWQRMNWTQKGHLIENLKEQLADLNPPHMWRADENPALAQMSCTSRRPLITFMVVF